jgi:hypothetical protein
VRIDEPAHRHSRPVREMGAEERRADVCFVKGEIKHGDCVGGEEGEFPCSFLRERN